MDDYRIVKWFLDSEGRLRDERVVFTGRLNDIEMVFPKKDYPFRDKKAGNVIISYVFQIWDRRRWKNIVDPRSR